MNKQKHSLFVCFFVVFVSLNWSGDRKLPLSAFSTAILTILHRWQHMVSTILSYREYKEFRSIRNLRTNISFISRSYLILKKIPSHSFFGLFFVEIDFPSSSTKRKNFKYYPKTNIPSQFQLSRREPQFSYKLGIHIRNRQQPQQNIPHQNCKFYCNLAIISQVK